MNEIEIKATEQYGTMEIEQRILEIKGGKKYQSRSFIRDDLGNISCVFDWETTGVLWGG